MMAKKFVCCLFLTAIGSLITVDAVLNEIRCGSVDIRNTPKMAFQSRSSNYKNQNDSLRYRDCTIIDGDITISMITQGNHSHDDYPVFESLREVTGSILVFHVESLMSLGKMFPNLRVIGGNSLIMNYALVIYQNQDLRQVNLTKLTTIKNGGVRITENAKLCYAKNINWEKIMVGKIRDFIVDQVAGRCENVCNVEDESICERDNGGKPICWNPTTCQKTCKNQIGQADHSGCTEAGEPCHPLCIGGCFEPNNPGACYTCRYFDVEGVCVEKCPPDMFAMLKRRCLTRQQCVELYPVIGPHVSDREERKVWKPFQGNCHYECPRDYHPDPANPHNCVKCDGYCPKMCLGDTVDSVGSAIKFSKCNIIDGNLEVDMRVGMESTSGEKFTEAFGEIEEITGYLLIRFSTAFMSLHMFKRLKVIRGDTLWKNMYALVVFENPNLRQLFQQSGIEISRGKISFQNNRMLCYKTITAFMKNAIIHENISESDVSSFSNGDKAICDEIPLEIKIVSVYSYGFILSWTPFNTTDMDHRKFLGYQIFYKQVDKEDYNMSIDDDRSACSDSWNMVFVTEGMNANELPADGTSLGTDGRESLTRGELVNQGIESNTLYAVYVQTRLVNHPGAQNAISKIHFVRTTFSVPDPPRTISAAALDANTLKIQWELPLNAWGVISHYTFSWMLDKPQPPANETLLCTMRSQNSRRLKHMASKNPSSASMGTCPREHGCCKCEGKLTSHLLPAHNNEDSRALEMQQEERAQFENAVQNSVFVQNCEVSYDPIRCPSNYQPPASSPTPYVIPISERNELSAAAIRKREIGEMAAKHRRRRDTTMDHQRILWKKLEIAFSKTKPQKISTSTTAPYYEQKSRRRRELPNVKADVMLNSDDKSLEALLNKENISEQIDTTVALNDKIEDMLLWEPYSESAENKLTLLRKEHPESTVLYVGRFDDNNAIQMGKVNVTTMSVVLTGLPHFSEYQINVYTCQDETAVEHFCSARPAWVSIKTQPIMEYDQVAPESVVLLNVTDGKLTDRKIYWEAPKRPNGVVLTYRVKLFRGDDSTPLEQCIPAAMFEMNNGILFSGLSAGVYSLEIRVESSTELLGNATIVKDLFEIPSPTFFTLTNILIMIVVCFLILLISTALCFRYAAHQVEGKMGDIVTQNISNNPDYLSQYNFYTADDWELNREDIVLKEKIGEGTFGSVRLGEGKGIMSNCGIRFGECAVKMITEDKQSQERYLFLCEANVMKKFNTEFIVKLYGVVSNGTPVLVVMELMKLGNLRDFLRKLRPDAEEKVNGKKPEPPSLGDYFTWAAQIADGMAYLEDLQFCHRDLAARNCMVHANRSVKIGDFGMTRDLYYQEYYKPGGKRLMPVRWMSPEALKDGTFSTRSDVWSYGIVLFEMLTLGEMPYGGLGNDEVFQLIVLQNQVPKRPVNCHDYWYCIMRACWQRESRRRPLFQQIVNHLKFQASEEFRRLSYVLNHMKPERICKTKYNFNQKYEDHSEPVRLVNEEYPENKPHPMTTSLRLNDEEDQLVKEKQSDYPEPHDSSRWVTNDDWSPDKDTNMDDENAKLSIASRAIKKAREFGAPLIGRRRQNRLYNYKADKLTVLATLLGFNPRISKGKKRSETAQTVNATCGNTSTVPNRNDYTHETQRNDTCLQMEKDDDEDDIVEDDEVEDEEEEEENECEDYDEEVVEEEDEVEYDERDAGSHEGATMHKELNVLPSRAKEAQQCDYVEADPAALHNDLMSKRRSASMTSTAASLSSYPLQIHEV